jgi:hypothetical protein
MVAALRRIAVSNDYLSRLALTPKERILLADLGAAGALAVLGIRRAAPAEFDQLFGPARAAEIAEQLAALLSAEERAVLDSPPVVRRPLGALLDEPPPVPSAGGAPDKKPS